MIRGRVVSLALLAVAVIIAASLAFAGAASAQSMQGKWQYLLKTVDGVNTGTVEIDARGTARASGTVTGVAYTQSGTASQNGDTVDIQFTEAATPGSALHYAPDHFICQFKSANLMDCKLPHPSGLETHAGYGPMARAGTQEAASLGQRPTEVAGNYYTDRRTGCRIWTRSFHADATVQWSGACKGGLAEGPGSLTLTHATPGETGDVEVRIEGQYAGGRLNGQALVTYNNGSRFEGQIVDGIQHGHGRYTQVGSGYYEGDYRDGVWFGHGVLQLSKECRTCDLPGMRYEGEFVSGKFQGTGVLTRANGDKYEGAWGNNLPNGPGTFTWNNGTARYAGKWSSGCSLSPQGQLYSFPDPNVHSCDVMLDYLRTYTNR